MVKKVIVIIILIVSIYCVYSHEIKKALLWFDLNLGGNDLLYEDGMGFSTRLGITSHLIDRYYLSFHFTSGGTAVMDANSESQFSHSAFDVQIGMVTGSEKLRIFPAVGIGYTDVGNWHHQGLLDPDSNDTNEKVKSVVALPVSCDLQLILTKGFGFQATGSVNLNLERTYFGFYGGIIFGNLRNWYRWKRWKEIYPNANKWEGPYKWKSNIGSPISIDFLFGGGKVGFRGLACYNYNKLAPIFMVETGFFIRTHKLQ
jgi:hypothetical protein